MNAAAHYLVCYTLSVRYFCQQLAVLLRRQRLGRFGGAASPHQAPAPDDDLSNDFVLLRDVRIHHHRCPDCQKGTFSAPVILLSPGRARFDAWSDVAAMCALAKTRGQKSAGRGTLEAIAFAGDEVAHMRWG